MHHATRSYGDRRKIERAFPASVASSASPHPRSATTSPSGFARNHRAQTSTGRDGHSFVCSLNPAWYAANIPGWAVTIASASAPVAV